MSQIELIELNRSDSKEVSFFEDLYMEAFPPEERRPLDKLFELYSSEIPFEIDLIKVRSEFIGFFTYWSFDSFIFAEHFAISDTQRGSGYGRKVIDLFVLTHDVPCILEVEKPTTKLAQRRIEFYIRAGFKLWDDIEYAQPPYCSEHEEIPMYLMTTGDLDLNERLTEIKSAIFKHVYNIIV